MSSNKITVNGSELDISGVDVFFVFECLKNLDSDRQINLTQVAESLGYSNVASVGNRLRSLKKRYGFANFEGRTAAASAKAASSAASNADTSINSVKNETDVAIAPHKKKGRSARTKTAVSNGHANGTTNGTSVNGEKKPSSKRKRGDNNDDNKEEISLSEKAPAKPAKRARGRGRGRPKETGPAGPAEEGRVSEEVAEVNVESSPKSASFCPVETVDPPLDIEELTETVRKMKRPADRMFLLAFETIKEARRERRLRREGPKTGLKLRFKKLAA